MKLQTVKADSIVSSSGYSMKIQNVLDVVENGNHKLVALALIASPPPGSIVSPVLTRLHDEVNVQVEDDLPVEVKRCYSKEELLKERAQYTNATVKYDYAANTAARMFANANQIVAEEVRHVASLSKK